MCRQPVHSKPLCGAPAAIQPAIWPGIPHAILLSPMEELGTLSISRMYWS